MMIKISFVHFDMIECWGLGVFSSSFLIVDACFDVVVINNKFNCVVLMIKSIAQRQYIPIENHI